MSLSGPRHFQNATSASRRSVTQVAKETFPNWVSRSVEMVANAKTVGPNESLKRHVRVQTDQKLVRTSNSEHCWQGLAYMLNSCPDCIRSHTSKHVTDSRS